MLEYGIVGYRTWYVMLGDFMLFFSLYMRTNPFQNKTMLLRHIRNNSMDYELPWDTGYIFHINHTNIKASNFEHKKLNN